MLNRIKGYPSGKNSIMILSAAAGAGHLRAADALVSAFAGKGINARHIEVLQYTNPVFKRLYSDLYVELMNKGPDLLGWIYNKLDKPGKFFKRRLALDKLNSTPLIKLIKNENPDIIICTHFLPPVILLHLRKKGIINSKIGIVITDFDAHATWIFRDIDWYFVAIEETKEYLKALGVPEERIHITGIPIDPVFSVEKSKKDTRSKLGLNPDRTTILVSAGGFGVGPVESLVSSVQNVKNPVQIIVICGKNKNLENKLLKSKNSSHPMKIIGFTKEMDIFMAASDILVGKAGGLTSSEALARGLALVIVNPIPGQETRNTDHFLEEGVAIRCNNFPTITYKIDKLLDDKDKLLRMQDNARRLSKPGAASTIVSIIQKFLFLFLIFLKGLSYAAPPVIKSVIPANGAASATITINGENFDSTCRVYFSTGGPYISGSVDTPGDTQGIFIAGDYAYLADGSSGLEIINIRDKVRPVISGNINFSDIAQDVHVKGSYAYVSAKNSGLHIVNINIVDPSKPYLTGNVKIPGNASGIDVSGNYAYVACRNAGLQIIDIFDPAAPRIAGSIDTPGHASDVYVSGSYAYVADSWMGLSIVNISDPSHPVISNSLKTSDWAVGVFFDSNFVYAAVGRTGVDIINVDDPDHPVMTKNIDTPGYAMRTYASGRYDKGIYVSGGYVYVADKFSGMQVISLFDFSQPRLLKGRETTPDEVKALFVADEYVYAAAGKSGLEIINITSPINSSISGSVSTPGQASGLCVSGNYAYVADGKEGLEIIDISDPSGPVIAGNILVPGDAADVCIMDSYIYLADKSGGIDIINILDPSHPVMTGIIDLPGTVNDIHASDNFVYAAGDGGLNIIDVSDPREFVIASSLDTIGTAYDVYVSGLYAYIAAGKPGLFIVDISDPKKPFIMGRAGTKGDVRRVYVSENYVYAADFAEGFTVINVKSPGHPEISSSFKMQGNILDIFVEGNYMYIAAGRDGLKIVDISDPGYPLPAGGVDTSGHIAAVKIAGDYAYIADSDFGLEIIHRFKAEITAGPVNFIDYHNLSVPVPAGISQGKYNIKILNSRHEQAVLRNGFTVLEP
ncbi:MAG: glycosyltransferase [bacterium]